jgi:site-specific recombinase XerD
MKKADEPLASYLTRDELLALLDAPARSTTSGMRDRAMLHLAFAAAPACLRTGYPPHGSA